MVSFSTARQLPLGLGRLVVAIVALMLSQDAVLAEQHPATADEGPLSEVLTAVGSEVALPCDLLPGTMIADKVQLVIWYRQGNVKPIYTFDARGRPLHQAIPWADDTVFNKKAHFHYDTNPPALRIKNIQTVDAGLYKCRVDFHKSPTRNWRINVTVLVPPTQLTILDNHGAEIRDQTAGPYLEGDSIDLTCLSSGGVPPPRVSWWREHALIDDSFQVLPDGSVRNVLRLKNIQRKDLLTMYTCQATNGHVVPALSKKVILDLNLPPLNLLLQGLNHAVVAGTRTHATCTAIGARPPPHIIWSKAGQILKGASQSTSADGNTTISELMLIPVPEDNERQVVCSISLSAGITSQQLHEGHTTVMTTLGNGNTGLYLKDSRVLNVTHAPIVILNLGAPLDPNNLLKGSDVYLECDVKANPAITRVEWYHSDKQLHSSRGIIISNQTLVLQGISKSSHGQYFCRASNLQGSVSSNEVYLDVKYPPVCKSESTIIRAALKQTINITCEVDANPLDNLNYKWHFNNSLESLIELPQLGPVLLSLKSTSGSGPGSGSDLGGYYQRSKRKHTHGLQRGLLHGRHGRTASIVDMSAVRFEDEDYAAEGHELDGYQDYGEETPYTQMVYSNMVHKNHVENKQPQRKQLPQLLQGQSSSGAGSSSSSDSHNSPGHHASNSGGSSSLQLVERKRLAALHKQQHHRQAMTMPTTTSAPPLNNVYSYHVESYESFGAISCVANSPMGQSQPCWYHIQPADLPEAVKNCTAYNATANSLQIQCIPGFDGGIPQYFHVQIYDELNRQILYNASYKYPEFTVKRLPSDSVFVIRVTAVNAQGPSKVAHRLRGRTLSAPLLRTASSTAVLVQLTPLLGALVGVIATLILVAICVVIFIKFRSKRGRRHGNGGDATTTEADKGSAEPLSRNMGSHSSLEDKNPDVVPQEANSEDEFHQEEKAFDRLNMESQRILYTPPTRINTASPPPPSLSPTFGKQYGELSLTTNPAFSLYNTPQRAPAAQRPVYTAPPPLLSTRTPPNIYTRIPGRGSGCGGGVGGMPGGVGATSYHLPAYETRTSPTSPYGSTTTCTMPLLGGQSNGSLQTNSSGGGGVGGVGACNTLPHPGSLHTSGISAALTSSVTSGNITIGAAQSLLTSPRSQTAYTTLGGGVSPAVCVQSPLLLAGGGNYETVSS
ncbi:uncharacterized protein LOC117890135 [Drosophila subobscura]|uniref:uncharacterized protein LOC117890135 n=1 Tax=Drosophila subobscura TaxID=7241 RepID=UPI00155A1B45|nr:uncharacterized protein LOC117890135 [Drosophila subobscura]